MEIKRDQLAVIRHSNYIRIHVDNYGNPGNYRTYCGLASLETAFKFLSKKFEFENFKICKKCSTIYRRKYGHSLEGFIAGLKVRGKLFMDN